MAASPTPHEGGREAAGLGLRGTDAASIFDRPLANEGAASGHGAGVALQPAGGQLAARELEFFSLRWWGVEEFGLALRATGFVDIVVSGDHEHERAPKKNDQAITFEARRPA